MLERIFGVIAVLATAAAPATAQQPEFAGKTITIYVAGTTGGGIDLYARWLARHMGRHIAGNPGVNVQVMPGAGGIRAASFLNETAPKDGTALATFSGGPLLEPLIGPRDHGYDASKFAWVGAITRDISLCIAWKAGPFQSLDDVKRREMVVAGTGAGSDTDTYPVLLNDVLGTKFRVVTGYLGSKETFLAIESGEAHGRCGMTWSALKAAKPDWIRDGKLAYLVQMGAEKHAELSDTPLGTDLIAKPEDRQLLELLSAGTSFGRNFAAAPGVAPARLEILRRAFDATMKDPAFIAEGGQLQADIEPRQGAEVQNLLARVYATPKPVIERLKKLLAQASN